MIPMKFIGLTVLLTLSAIAGTAHAEGMPQLNFANKLLTAQVVWGAVIFFAFWLLASRWGLPKVGAILDMRAETIARDLDQARAAKADADRAVAELTAARRESYAQSQAAIAEATAKAKAIAAAQAAEQEAKLSAQLAQSEAQIAQARASAMGALRDVATETALAVVAKVAYGHADQHRIQDAVGQILAERGLAA
jgi:F-type H+-transporting ATPase subunit b